MSSPLSVAAVEQTKEAGIFRIFIKPIMPSEIQDKLFHAWNEGIQSSLSIEERLKEYKPHILLIEPRDMDQEIIKVILRKLGAEIVVLSDIDSVYHSGETTQYDVILVSLDYDFNSITKLVKDFRGREDKKNPVAIWGLVNASTPLDIKKCQAAGFNQIIQKPIDPELFKQTLCNQLLGTT